MEWSSDVSESVMLHEADDVETDFVLSQIDIPSFTSRAGMTLSQSLDLYDIEPDDLAHDEELGNFVIQTQWQSVNTILSQSPGNSKLSVPADGIQKTENQDTGRFRKPLTEGEIEELVAGQKCKNTEKSTRWAVNVFEQWREARNESIPSLSKMLPDDINKWLAKFVVEARKQDGTPYPPKSLYVLSCGLLRYFKENNQRGMNFLDEHDGTYLPFRRVLDAEMKRLTKAGLGITTRQADPLSPADEEKLWELGVFGTTQSSTLQSTLFFYNCKLFGLRGKDEHRNLTRDQFILGEDSVGIYVEFHGKDNKTYKGGLKHKQVNPKAIRHHGNGGERCVVAMYHTYLGALDNAGEFYRTPIDGNGIRYSQHVVGVNKLQKMMGAICSAAGLKGDYTNHSGKRTCATQLYQNGFDEQISMSITGHRSIQGVRKYKQPSPAMLSEVSNTLMPPPPKQPKASCTVSKESTIKSETTVEDQENAPVPIKVMDTIPPAGHSGKPNNDNEFPFGISNSRQGNVFSNCVFNFGGK